MKTGSTSIFPFIPCVLDLGSSSSGGADWLADLTWRHDAWKNPSSWGQV